MSSLKHSCLHYFSSVCLGGATSVYFINNSLAFFPLDENREEREAMMRYVEKASHKKDFSHLCHSFSYVCVYIAICMISMKC